MEAGLGDTQNIAVYATGGAFLTPAEGRSLRLHQKGPSDNKVILADGRTN